MARKFYVELTVHDDEWCEDQGRDVLSNLATWIDAAMNRDTPLGINEVDTVVYNSLADLNADHILEALGGIE